MSKHIFICHTAKGFNFFVSMKNPNGEGQVKERVKFNEGQFHTDDDKLASAIEKAIAGGGAIGQKVIMADRSAAEALAKRHMEQNAVTGAHKGGVTSDAAKAAMSTSGLQERDKALAAAGGVDNKAFADAGLALSVAGADVKPKVADAPASKPAAPLKLGKG